MALVSSESNNFEFLAFLDMFWIIPPHYELLVLQKDINQTSSVG
jgi:hypothetical protein